MTTEHDVRRVTRGDKPPALWFIEEDETGHRSQFFVWGDEAFSKLRRFLLWWLR